MSTDRVIFAKDGKADWPAGKPAVTKIVLGTPPPQQGSAEEFISTKIPADLAERFPALTHLHLWGIKNLKQLPKLPAGLKTLDVRNCQALSALPDALPEALEILDTGRCGALPALPAALPAGLQELFIDGCKSLAEGALPTLPATLEVLDASATRGVNTLPGALLDEKKYPALRDLRVEPGVRIGEHVAGPDVLAPFQGKNALETLRAWWRGIQASGADTTPYVKVFLLGNGQAGKSALCCLVSGQPLPKKWNTTHGAQLADIPPGGGRLALPGVGLAVWDFGGQDIYHGTHALFTDAHALYVIVWTNDRKRQGDREAKPKELRYWLEYVAALSKPEGDAPGRRCRVVLAESGSTSGESHPPGEIPARLIPTKVGYDLDPSRSEEEQLAASGRVLECIREQAKAVAGENEGTLPKSWGKVREKLREPAQRAEQLLSSDEFADICRAEGIDDAEGIRSVRGYLHQCGAIFHKPGLFDGRIVVDQQWALDAIYAVLDRGRECILRQPGRDGSFTIQELKRTVWQDKTDEVAALLVEMMVQCKVCFRWGENNDGERRWLAPELLPDRVGVRSGLIETMRTNYPAPLNSQVFRYDFLHDGILRAIMANVGGHAGTGAVYWKSGLCAYDLESEVFVVLEAGLTPERGEGRGQITAELFGSAESRAHGPWTWITGLLQEQRPTPDPADMKAAAMQAPAEEEEEKQFRGLAAAEFMAAGKSGFRGGEPRHLGVPQWVFTVEADADFATSRKATIQILRDRVGRPLPRTNKKFPEDASLSPEDFTNYLLGSHPDPAGFETKAVEFGRGLTYALRYAAHEGEFQVSDEFAKACERADAFSAFLFHGDPEFHRIPWELMEVSGSLPPALRFGFLRHCYSGNVADPVFPDGDILKVLWVISRPVTQTVPGESAVLKPVQDEVGQRVMIKPLLSGSLRELDAAMRADSYHIVHLDMHGDIMRWEDFDKRGADFFNRKDRKPLERLQPWEGEKAVLLFSENGSGSKIVPVTAEELAGLMQHRGCPPLLTLNACHSGAVPPSAKASALPAYLVEAGIPGVLGFQGSVALPLAIRFYRDVFATLVPANLGPKDRPGDVEYAVREARTKLHMNWKNGSRPRMDWWAPVYYASRNLQLFRR